ncbi:MAG: MobA/MobL family protein [Proteobacteria bacterium]|jgi:hypothetical protein|nr:MobA/MobL family protein [Pseudomonadota bacterium]
MAIYHANTKAISRGKGHSSTANAAYIGGKEITDLRTGEVFNYKRKGGVLENEIVLPNGIELPELSSQELWNRAERSENRKDARVGREWEISLPHELSAEQRAVLAKSLALNIAERYGVACEYAIHHPSRENSDERNHHVHILTTTRKIDSLGNLGEKSEIELDRKQCAQRNIPTSQEQISEIREQIAIMINKHLELALCHQRVSHLSLEAQGIKREPTTHKGKALCEQERRLELQAVKIEAQIAHDGNKLAKANAELAKLQQDRVKIAMQDQLASRQHQQYLAELEKDKAEKLQEQARPQCYFSSPDKQQIDLDKLFTFARENGDFFTKDTEKHCYTNKDKSIEVYKNVVAINIATESNIAKGLKLAQAQFGNNLEITGSDEFKAQAIEVVASSLEFKEIQLRNPEQQAMLNWLRDNHKLEQQATQALTAREQARQRLVEPQQPSESLEAAKNLESLQAETKLSAREIARQRVANTELRSTKEVVNDYTQQKAQEQKQQQEQVKVKELTQELELGHRRGGGWGMSR